MKTVEKNSTESRLGDLNPGPTHYEKIALRILIAPVRERGARESHESLKRSALCYDLCYNGAQEDADPLAAFMTCTRKVYDFEIGLYALVLSVTAKGLNPGPSDLEHLGRRRKLGDVKPHQRSLMQPSNPFRPLVQSRLTISAP